MMTFLSFIVFLPPIFLGTALIHYLWPEKTATAFFLKASLGIGFGLGLNSILYFLVLQVAPGRIGRISLLTLQIIILASLLTITLLRARKQKWSQVYLPTLSRLQWGMISITLLALFISTLVFINTINARPQGEYDAWSIWNRAARFIYRDPENWRATLSPDLEQFTHADYPLLIPLNVASGWEVLGNETLRLPMAQSALFIFSIIILMFSALSFTRTIGQASLATVLLLASSIFIVTGTNMTADIPVAYFIFASSILMYLFFLHKNAALLVLSGFMAGLAGWTKNEGLLLIAVGPFALIMASPKNIKRSLLYYLAGLAIPLMIIFFLKSLTPTNDLLNNDRNSLIAKITDLSRYWEVLKAFAKSFFNSSVIFLFIYTAIMHNHLTPDFKKGSFALFALLLLQLLGYFVVFVITPNDLAWQLSTSMDRLILQVTPLLLFLCFSISSDPETIFS